jgi:glycosyltransferase involved in cell wall biosynthesis
MLSSSTVWGGAEKYLLTIAKAAIQDGLEVHAAFPRRPTTEPLAAALKEAGGHYQPTEIREPGDGRLARVSLLLRFLRTLVLLLRVRPRAVHVNLPWPSHCLGSMLACALLKMPTLVTFHLVARAASLSRRRPRVYAWMRGRGQTWVAVSDNIRRLLAQSFQVKEHEVVRIYNGSSSRPRAVTAQERAALRQRLRRSLQLPEFTRIVLTVARLDAQKGHEDVLSVAPRLVSSFPDVVFVWAGDGSLAGHFTRRLEAQPLGAKVFMLGRRDDVPELLAASDLFLFPSRYEGLPFALLEAMAHGLPVVTSDASSMTEVIEDGTHGLVFKAGDPEELLQNLEWALSHPQQMADMAARAERRAADFSEEAMASKTVGLLREIAGAGGAGTAPVRAPVKP